MTCLYACSTERKGERGACSHACKATRSAIAPLTMVVLVAANAHCNTKPHMWRKREKTRVEKRQRKVGREVKGIVRPFREEVCPKRQHAKRDGMCKRDPREMFVRLTRARFPLVVASGRCRGEQMSPVERRHVMKKPNFSKPCIQIFDAQPPVYLGRKPTRHVQNPVTTLQLRPRYHDRLLGLQLLLYCMIRFAAGRGL